MGIFKYLSMYPQVYPQLYPQPYFWKRNEQKPTPTPPHLFCTKSNDLLHAFNTTLNTCAHHYIIHAHERTPSTLSHPVVTAAI